jgi:hypothetical protein
MALSCFIDAISINNVITRKEPISSPERGNSDVKADVRRNVHLSAQTCADLTHFSEKLKTNQSKLIRTILNHVFIGWKQHSKGEY